MMVNGLHRRLCRIEQRWHQWASPRVRGVLRLVEASSDVELYEMNRAFSRWLDWWATQLKCDGTFDPEPDAPMEDIEENAKQIWYDTAKPFCLAKRVVSWDRLRGTGRLHQALGGSGGGGGDLSAAGPKWLATKFNRLWNTLKAAERWVETAPEVLEIMRNPRRPNILYLIRMTGVSRNRNHRVPAQRAPSRL